MSERKMGHTPGPWSIERTYAEDIGGAAFPLGHWIAGPDGEQVADPSLACVLLPEDARLIAAAPDLLALARYAVDNPEFDSATFDAMARAAIAKAHPNEEEG